MTSLNFIIIELEPLYQKFLLRVFNCDSEVFMFPEDHGLKEQLEKLLHMGPCRELDNEVDMKLFKIGLPMSKNNNNPEHIRRLTEMKERVFRSKIIQYCEMKIQNRIEELMSSSKAQKNSNEIKFNRQECLSILIEEYEIEINDGIFKQLNCLFTKYLQKERGRKFRSRKKNESK
jgi:hypothetical protein